MSKLIGYKTSISHPRSPVILIIPEKLPNQKVSFKKSYMVVNDGPYGWGSLPRCKIWRPNVGPRYSKYGGSIISRQNNGLPD